MLGSLEKEFDYLLEQEAVRIMGRLLVMYEEKKKVDKSFDNLIKDLARDKYSYFWIEISCRVRKLLPYILSEDITEEYALTSSDEYREQYLEGYKKYHQKSKKENLFKVADTVANYIIEFCNHNPNCKEDLLQVIIDFIPKVLPEHNDSVDCKMVIMYLQQEINRKGYCIMNLSPLRIEYTKC